VLKPLSQWRFAVTYFGFEMLGALNGASGVNFSQIWHIRNRSEIGGN